MDLHISSISAIVVDVASGRRVVPARKKRAANRRPRRRQQPQRSDVVRLSRRGRTAADGERA